jgi:hypothetical protein
MAITTAAPVEHTVITNAITPKTGNPIQNSVHHLFCLTHLRTSDFGFKGIDSKWIEELTGVGGSSSAVPALSWLWIRLDGERRLSSSGGCAEPKDFLRISAGFIALGRVVVFSRL